VNSIDTDAFSARLRSAAVDPEAHKLLVTRFSGSKQESDLSEPPNCGGFGRIRHFRRGTSAGWPSNPLPIDPARHALNLPPADLLRAQAFQNAACNWRCWYCFVPFELLAAKSEHSGWLTADELVNLYLVEKDRPAVIDLTGGQPDLIPEWVPWTMDALESRGVRDSVYLWSDDNLSNDYFWRFLTETERERVATYPMYGRVCCFKGFNEGSFTFNTRAAPALYDRQFELMGRLLATGMDLYAYATFTTPSRDGIASEMAVFVDRLQQLDSNLPLRTIPLEIQLFSPVTPRMKDDHRVALENQWFAIEAWNREITERFAPAERSLSITEVPLRGRRRS
jgi:uncharacterized Fe-S cluster-containing radical SAM superfamily protein